jgi:hypothetical protein
VVIHPDKDGHSPSMHMNEHGITLRHGPHKGRLLRPTRWYAGRNEQARWPRHYTNAIYSDDGGRTWHTSDPFPANGTGEAAVAELSDGRIYYNSRRHWAPQGENPRRRWTAWSDDGGQTWADLSICDVLPDGDQDRDYGLMGGLVRLPVSGRDILIFSNIESPSGRAHGTLWASFDGGHTWPIKRRIYDGSFAYSSLDAGRPGTPGEGWIYLLFEGGPKGGGTLARFNLSWLLQGERTGSGDLPTWLQIPDWMRKPAAGVKPTEDPNGWGLHRQHIALEEGMNVITVNKGGHVYVSYFDDQAEQAPQVPVHFPTGRVNGFFDLAKHTSADWDRLLDEAVSPIMDARGRHIQVAYPVAWFNLYTRGKGVELIGNYDTLLNHHYTLMGLVKDYGDYEYHITQSMVDETRSYIADRKYPKPADDLTRVED